MQKALIVLALLLCACGTVKPIDPLNGEPGGVLLSERYVFAEGDVTVTVLEQLGEVRAFAVFYFPEEMNVFPHSQLDAGFTLSSGKGSNYSYIDAVRGEQDTYTVEVGALPPGASRYCYSLKFLYTFTDRQAQEPDFSLKPVDLEGCT